MGLFNVALGAESSVLLTFVFPVGLYSILHCLFCCIRWSRTCGPPFWLWSGFMVSRWMLRRSGSFWLWRLCPGCELRKVKRKIWSIDLMFLKVTAYPQSADDVFCVFFSAASLVTECVEAGNALLGCNVQKDAVGLWRVHWRSFSCRIGPLWYIKADSLHRVLKINESILGQLVCRTTLN